MSNILKPKALADDIQYFLKMFRFMKPYGFRYGISQLIYSAQGFVFQFTIALFLGNIMAAIVAWDTDMVVSAVTIFVVMAAILCLALGIALYVNIIVIEKAMLDLKKTLFRTFVRNGLEDTVQSHSGESIAAINTDSDTAKQIFQRPLFEFLSCVITIAGSAIVIFAINWLLGLAALFVGLISFMFHHRFTKPLAKIGKERLEANANSVKTTSNFLSGAMAIRAYNMQSSAILAFDHDNKQIKLLDFRHGLIGMWQSLFATVQGWLTLVVVFALGGWLVAIGRLEFHLIMVVLGMFTAIVTSVGNIGKLYADLQVPIAGTKRVFAILDDGKHKLGVKENQEIAIPNGYKISLKDLHFRYRGAKFNALVDINLEVEENQMIAIVGESGSGKSTLLRAIIGMYERDNSGISLGGLKFNDTPLHDWRRNFAYVDQSCKLFDMTIKKNISMGYKGSIDDADIIDATKRVAAHDFIEQLEEKYNSSCGEKGALLSGGQKQRIAIARALVKKAPILVFDEITSALDDESQRNIMDVIESLRHNHTILMATHNLCGITKADKIVVMKEGRIVEVGDHDALITKKGSYYELFTE